MVLPIISFHLFVLFISLRLYAIQLELSVNWYFWKAAKIQSQRLTRVLCVISSLKLYAAEVTHHHNQESLYILFNNKTEKVCARKTSPVYFWIENIRIKWRVSTRGWEGGYGEVKWVLWQLAIIPQWKELKSLRVCYLIISQFWLRDKFDIFRKLFDSSKRHD